MPEPSLSPREVPVCPQYPSCQESCRGPLREWLWTWGVHSGQPFISCRLIVPFWVPSLWGAIHYWPQLWRTLKSNHPPCINYHLLSRVRVPADPGSLLFHWPLPDSLASFLIRSSSHQRSDLTCRWDATWRSCPSDKETISLPCYQSLTLTVLFVNY